MKMADRNEKVLLELIKYPGNNACADCGSKSKFEKVYFVVASRVYVRYASFCL